MLNKEITGKKLAEEVIGSLGSKTTPDYYPPLDFSKYKRDPSLHILLVGDHPSSLIYIERKMKAAKLCGVKAHLHRFQANCSQEELIGHIRALSKDAGVDAIVLQLPLPPHLDSSVCIEAIAPEKDVDGLTALQMGKLATDPASATIACTPLGIWSLLKAIGVDLKGQEVVVVGRSRIVGRPLELLLSSQLVQANVTTLHSQSDLKKPLSHWTKRGDVLILAAGKKEYFHEEHIHQGAVVIDVGIHSSEEKGRSITGDADYASMKNKTSYISTVPGGVGPMTVASLMYNCWKLALF